MTNYNNSSPTVTNCSFSGNTATYWAGGMSNNVSSNPTVTNCSFSGNTATTNGGGGMTNSISNPTVTNCSFSGNTSVVGGGMYNATGSSPTVTNCILWGDSPDEIFNSRAAPTIRFSDVQGGLPAGAINGGGNIDSDPLFADADGADNMIGSEDDDLNLLPGSLCIDSGRFIDFNSILDFDGNDRSVDDPATLNTGTGTLPFLDMGAYEFQPPPCNNLPGDINCDGIVNLLDWVILAAHWLETTN